MERKDFGLSDSKEYGNTTEKKNCNLKQSRSVLYTLPYHILHIVTHRVCGCSIVLWHSGFVSFSLGLTSPLTIQM